MAALAIGGAVAASAFAFENLPHYGKCLAKAGGKYKSAGCTKLAKTAEEQKFEWESLGTGAVKFTSKKKKKPAKRFWNPKKGPKMSCAEQKQNKSSSSGSVKKRSNARTDRYSSGC